MWYFIRKSLVAPGQKSDAKRPCAKIWSELSQELGLDWNGNHSFREISLHFFQWGRVTQVSRSRNCESNPRCSFLIGLVFRLFWGWFYTPIKAFLGRVVFVAVFHHKIKCSGAYQSWPELTVTRWTGLCTETVAYTLPTETIFIGLS